jgi:hypothetical protein
MGGDRGGRPRTGAPSAASGRWGGRTGAPSAASGRWGGRTGAPCAAFARWGGRNSEGRPAAVNRILPHLRSHLHGDGHSDVATRSRGGLERREASLRRPSRRVGRHFFVIFFLTLTAKIRSLDDCW